MNVNVNESSMKKFCNSSGLKCLINEPTTARKVSAFGVILARIFPHSDWDTFYAVDIFQEP